MKRLVIDVTQLMNWQGKLTGIPRVMNELASRFATQPGCTLVIWRTESKTFQEISYAEIVSKRIPDVPRPSPQESTSLSKNSIKHAVKTVEAYFPATRRVRQHLQRKYNAYRQSKVTVGANIDQFSFEQNDVLLILWGGWHDQIYIDEVLSLRRSGVIVVQIVYDMLPLVTPQYSGHSTEALGNYAATLYPECALLIAISQNSSDDVTRWLRSKRLPVPATKVIRLGEDFIMSKPLRPQEEVFKKANLKGNDYVLCVGTIEVRKNHAILYYAYKLAKQKGIKLPKLVIVGRRGWLTDDIFTLMTTDPEVTGSFVFLQNASDEELSWLYDHCMFSVYPSFYEGWGLPIAESIAHGIPCIASNTSSIPEIAGDLIDYFSPMSADECLAAIQHLTSQKNIASAKKRIKRYRPTSWDQTFTSVDAYIKELRK